MSCRALGFKPAVLKGILERWPMAVGDMRLEGNPGSARPRSAIPKVRKAAGISFAESDSLEQS
jgi:hypothetical protein